MKRESDTPSLILSGGCRRGWRPIIAGALEKLPAEYLSYLLENGEYLPGKERLLAAFDAMEPDEVKYILFGQDPYPRRESATGYAFMDGRVDRIFCEKGLCKEVNRATSLRNFMKMLLVAAGELKCDDLSQSAIASIAKDGMIETMDELKDKLSDAGVLLLNSSLVFDGAANSGKHISLWRPFMESLLDALSAYDVKLILFGAHAAKIEKLEAAAKMEKIKLPHPYNHSFICLKEALELFGSMDLLFSKGLKS